MLSVSNASMYLKLYDMYLLARSEPLVSMIRSTTNHQTYPKSIPSKNSINQQDQIILILIVYFSSQIPPAPPKKR